MFSQYSFSKNKPTLDHSDKGTSEKTSNNCHKLSESDSDHSPVKPKMSEKNGVNGNPKVYTVSDSESDGENSKTSTQVISSSDQEREDNHVSPAKSPVKTYSRIKQMKSSPSPLKKVTDSVEKPTAPSGTGTGTVETSSPFKRKASTMKHSKVKKKRRKNSNSSDDANEYKSGSVVVDSDMDSDEEVSNQMNLSQKKVFEFLNDASKTELLLVPSSTEKKSNALVSLRPYKNWRHAVEQFKNTRSLGLSFLNSISNFLKTRSTVSNLMKKCLNIAVETESVVSNGKTQLKQQPALLTESMSLKSYQMVGLNWLVVMHSQNLNVILADEMGLGKTIQVISFLAYLNETAQTNNPHLVVAPSSTIENWACEFAKWCPNFNVVIYHGSPDERRILRVQWFKEKFVGIDVIITTYNMISSSFEEKKMFKILPIQYVIFDEAHMLKNMNTQRYVNLFSINAERRILLTGTPLQNNLLELMSLLNFVMPDMFHSKIEYIKEFFSKKTKLPVDDLPEFEQEQIELAKRIMKPFILRRLKKDVLQDLPKKTSEVIKCPMTEEQKIKYDIFKEDAAELAKHGGPDYNYMSTFMSLRKLANHPLTLRYIFDEKQLKVIASLLAEDIFYKDTNKDYIFDDLIFMSDHDIHKLALEYTSITRYRLDNKKFLAGGKFAKLNELLPKLKDEGHRVIIFSQFLFVLDLLEEYLKINDHKYLRLDGSTKSLDRQDLIDNYNEDASIFVFLCTTKAGGIGINLTTADTVIIHDVDFNPYNDKQAEDRCHRIGQTKPVHIMRFISEGTVEEVIYKMAQDKLTLEQELTTNSNEDESEDKTTVELLLKEALGIK